MRTAARHAMHPSYSEPCYADHPASCATRTFSLRAEVGVEEESRLVLGDVVVYTALSSAIAATKTNVVQYPTKEKKSRDQPQQQ